MKMMGGIEGMYGLCRSRDCFPYSSAEAAGKEVDLVCVGRPYNILLYSYRGSSSCWRNLVT